MSANTGNIIGGHKANLSKSVHNTATSFAKNISDNPNTSDGSKKHSRQVLEDAENGGQVEAASNSGGDKNHNNVADGLKATLNNPNTSDEAKQSARERLNDM